MTTVNPHEVTKFSRLASHWWDEEGPYKALHIINPLRLKYILDHHAAHLSMPLTETRILDIGCGGGLLCEPLARLGAQVTGVDASPENIVTAMEHAHLEGLSISYKATTAEALREKEETFDMVIAMEIIEHVADVTEFLETAAALVRPGGIIVLSTINRTVKSFLQAIVAAEYILRWVPRGTHHWQHFVAPSEMVAVLRNAGFTLKDTTGMTYQLSTRTWEFTTDLSVNYFLVMQKDG